MNGEQCKAPAEKGSHICYAHAGQRAVALRRERERRAVLAEAVAEMRRRGRPEFEMADLFMDFKGIQVTLAVMARALINGRIDCRTAGRLAVEMQMMSKLLWMVHRKGREDLPLINTGDTDQKKLPNAKPLPRIHGKPGQVNTDDADLKKRAGDPNLTTTSWRQGERQLARRNWAATAFFKSSHGQETFQSNHGEKTRIASAAEALALPDGRGWPHGPPGWARAA
jgi:hypothetical protein